VLKVPLNPNLPEDFFDLLPCVKIQQVRLSVTYVESVLAVINTLTNFSMRYTLS